MAIVTPGAFQVETGGKLVTIYEPLPHQLEFHQSKARYTLISGGRGSGKSLAMRMEALMMAYAIPNFKALIVRRTAPELKKSHLAELPFELSKMGLPKDAFHITDMLVRMPHNHSTVQFGHVEDLAALTKWLSTSYCALFVDEATTFTREMWGWLLTSLRSTIPNFIPYAKLGTNPVGNAGWVRDLWITRAALQKPDEYRDYNPKDYHNIHCTLDDNPHVDPEVYAAAFDNVPSKATYDALRHGIWTIEGQFFEEWAEQRDGKPWHVIDALPKHHGVPIDQVPGIEVFRSIDWGYAAPGVCLTFAAMPDGTLVVIDEYVFRGTLPEEVAAEMKRRSSGLKVRYTVADPAMWAEHEGPSIAEHFELAGVPMIEGDRNRKPGWVTVHKWLTATRDDGLGERPLLRVVRHACPHLIRTLPEMVVDDTDPEDMKTKHVEDHACFIAGTLVRTESGLRPVETLEEGDRVWTRQGLKPITAARMTGVRPVWTLTTTDGSVTATADHPFWTSTGWKSLSQLSPGEHVWRWSGEARGSTDLKTTRTGHTDPTGRHTWPGESKGSITSIESCSEPPSGIFLKGGRSTTVMGTLWTIASRILKRCRRLSTAASTGGEKALPLLRRLYRRLRSGIGHLPGRRGISSTADDRGTTERPSSTTVTSAANPTLLVIAGSTGFVATNASLRSDVGTGMTTSNGRAHSATPSSRLTGIEDRSAVRVSAQAVCGVSAAGTRPVYNLTVADAHEYFANDFLVSNCDALRYGLMSRPTASRLPQNTELSFARKQLLLERPLGSRLGTEATRRY